MPKTLSALLFKAKTSLAPLFKAQTLSALFKAIKMQFQYLFSICLATASFALPAPQNVESGIEARFFNVSFCLIYL
jgi:hypothetical protein